MDHKKVQGLKGELHEAGRAIESLQEGLEKAWAENKALRDVLGRLLDCKSIDHHTAGAAPLWEEARRLLRRML